MASSLQLDQALVILRNQLAKPVLLCHQVTECIGCDLQCCDATAASANFSLVLTSKYTQRIVLQVNQQSYCSSDKLLLDREVSALTVSDNASCSYRTLEEGSSETVALWAMAGVYLLLALVVYTAVHLWKRYKRSGQARSLDRAETDRQKADEDGEERPAVAAEAERSRPRQRLLSLDAFRGATIMLMVSLT